MKTLIITILFLSGAKLIAQSNTIEKIDSIVSAIDFRNILSLDSGMVQLTVKGKYAKFETVQYDNYATKQLAIVNYFRVYVDKEKFVVEGNSYSGWYRDFIDFRYNDGQLVKITYDVGAGLIDSTFLMLQRHQYYFENGKLIHELDDSFGDNYSNYFILSSDTLYQMGKSFLDNYKTQIR